MGVIHKFARQMTLPQLRDLAKSTLQGIRESRAKHLYGKSAELKLWEELRVIRKEMAKR